MYNAINSTVQKCLHYCFLIGTILYAGIARAQQPDTLYFTLPELEFLIFSQKSFPGCRQIQCRNQ